MTPEHWQRIKSLLHSPLERDASERVAFLNKACAGDELLRSELDSFIISHEQAENFIEEPAFEVMAGSIANNQADSMVGHTFGHYEILEQLGAGGMGEVYLAQDARLGRKVALKMLPAYFTTHDERVRRFQQEARTASALNHPNILTIFETGQVDARHFIATEFIEGETLRRRMTQGEIDIGEALDFAIQVASALSAAHQAGIVHRDIKPENIMLRTDGIIKVLDFGLAKLTEREPGQGEGTLVNTKQGVVMGTARYMSPEQARGLKIDGRSDVWSLAVVLYEMVARRPPFDGQTASDVIVSILEKEPAPLTQNLSGARKELQEILAKALRKDVADRYQTSREVLVDLKGLKDGLEFDAKLERSLKQNSNEGAVRPAGEKVLVETPASRTAKIENAGVTTSREYVVNVTRLQKVSVAVIASILLLAVAWVAYSLFTRGNKNIHSLAVLPFKSVDGQGRDEPLELGMADALITRLSEIKQIDVRSSGAIFRYAGQNKNHTQVGRELRVDAVLEGNIRRQGDQVRVSVQLVNVGDGKTLWAETFDAKATDFFATQDALAEQIIRPLTLTLTGVAHNTTANRKTSNPEAYQLFLKGRYWFGKNTPEAHQKACDYFNQSIAVDKNYLNAYSGLADCHSMLASGRLAPPTENLRAAKAAAEKAVQLDDNSAAGHTSLGHLKWLTWDWDGAEKEFQRVLELDPPWPAAHLWYAWYFSSLGRHQEASAIIRKAQENNPISIVVNECAQSAHYFARQYDEAIAMGLKNLELEPGRLVSMQWLALAYEEKHMYDEAVANDLKAKSLRGVKPDEIEELRGAYAAAGWRGYWLKQIERTRAATKERYVSPFSFAEMYARVGDKERAFEFLEKAYAERAGDLTLLKVSPVFDTLRSDSRYEDLMRRVGFPE